MTAPNPFAPPSADLSLPSEAQADIRKPRSVWVMQFLGGLVAFGNTAGFALSIYGMASVGALGQKGSWPRLAWALCLVLALLLMLWQLPKRSRFGRNMGLVMIALLAYGAISANHGVNSPNIFFTIGQWTPTAILVSVLAYWAFAFAFSEKARRYFATSEND